MFYRKASPPTSVKSSGQAILLLHGQSFKSETWQNLGTMHLMAGIGHLVVAVDLPGCCLICYLFFYMHC
jgi:abhydrolase domain-containing protein 14